MWIHISVYTRYMRTMYRNFFGRAQFHFLIALFFFCDVFNSRQAVQSYYLFSSDWLKQNNMHLDFARILHTFPWTGRTHCPSENYFKRRPARPKWKKIFLQNRKAREKFQLSFCLNIIPRPSPVGTLLRSTGTGHTMLLWCNILQWHVCDVCSLSHLLKNWIAYFMLFLFKKKIQEQNELRMCFLVTKSISIWFAGGCWFWVLQRFYISKWVRLFVVFLLPPSVDDHTTFFIYVCVQSDKLKVGNIGPVNKGCYTIFWLPLLPLFLIPTLQSRHRIFLSRFGKKLAGDKVKK